MKVKNVLNKLLAGVLAAGMIASTVPAMAEEAAPETITSEIKASNIVTVVTNRSETENKAYVNQLKGGDHQSYFNCFYSQYDIPNVAAATKVVLKIDGQAQKNRDNTSLYVETDTSKFAEIKTTGVYDSTTSEYQYYKKPNNNYSNGYLDNSEGECVLITNVDNKNSAFLAKLDESLSFNESGSYNGIMKLNYSDKLETLKTNGGKIAFRTRGGSGDNIRLDEATLLVTYNKDELASVAQTELAAANTAEKVKAFVEKWNNSLFTVDTKSLSDMSKIYNALAEQGFTSVDDFVAAYNNAIKANLVEVEIPLSYFADAIVSVDGAIGSMPKKLLVNKKMNFAARSPYMRTYVEFDIPSIEAARSLVLKVNAQVEAPRTTAALYVMTDGFFEKYNDGLYSEASTEYANYVDKFSKGAGESISITADTEFVGGKLTSAYTGYVKLDYSKKLEALKSNGGKLAFRTRGGDNRIFELNKATVLVTYDMTAMDNGFEADVKAATTAQAMKSVFDKYNGFIGADTSMVANADVVYAELAAKVAEGTVYTYEALKADFEECAKKNLVEVRYNSPSDFVLYRYDGRTDSYNAKFHSGRAWLNTTIGYVDDSNDKENYQTYVNMGTSFNLYHVYPILGYELKDTQAITKVEFDFTSTSSKARVFANVDNSFVVSDKAATEYNAGTDVFTATENYYKNVFDVDKRYYVDSDKKFDLTDNVLGELKANNSNYVNLVLRAGTNCFFDMSNAALVVTYDKTALTPNTAVNDYNTSIATSEEAKGGARKKTTVEATITANKTTTEGFTVIGAAYKDGVLVNVKTATCNAMNVMGREKVRFEGLADCEHDTIRVFTLSGEGGMQPVADDVTLSE